MSEETLASIDDELTRIREDHLAKNHCGYFKLWSMELSRGRDNNWGHLPWIKDKLLGVFSSREPCEAFLNLIEHGPWATYSFHTFHHDINHISGYWEVEVDESGVMQESDRTNFLSPAWKEGWRKVGIDHENKSGRIDGDKFTGQARSKARALELALESKADYEEFIRTERPKRAKGCYCSPWEKTPCGKCKDVEIEVKKKDCGCPHCEGDN